MKKNILAFLVSATLMVTLTGMLAGCADQSTQEPTQDVSEQTDGQVQASGEPAQDADAVMYLSDFNAADHVTLGEYKGIEVEIKEPEVADEDVDMYIDYVLSARAESVPVTDRGVETGDTVNVDFEGKLDGVPFEGGSAQGFDMTIGAGGFIDGFEEGIVGMETGETKDLDLAFPDPYTNNPDLAGEPVVFTITVNSISQQVIPELSDELVAQLAIEDCTTVAEYREYVRDGLMENAQAAYEEEKSSAALALIEENSTFQDAPEGMTSRMKEAVVSTMASYAKLYGVSVEDYVAAAFNSTADAYEDIIMEQANLMARRYMMVGAIAAKEGIAITDAKLDEILAEEAENYGYENLEAYKEEIDLEAYREYLLAQEVMAFLAENTVAVSPIS